MRAMVILLDTRHGPGSKVILHVAEG